MLLAELPNFPEMMTALRDALPVIVSLIVIEGLLSVDNALAIAAMASHLDEKRRKVAMNIGYLGAYGFRVVALLVAGWIIHNEWIKLLGALYLIWLMCEHFAELVCGDGEGKDDVLDLRHKTFASTVAMIAFMDLSLSVDNVVAAIALSPDRLWPVYVGVTIGIISLRLVAGYAVKMIEKYPVLEHTAFLLIGYVGFLLLAEIAFHFQLNKLAKFAGIVLITAASIYYSKTPALRTALWPFMRTTVPPMRWFATVFAWPFRKVAALVRCG